MTKPKSRSHRKSCDPQLSHTQPTDDWGVEQLGQYAQARHEEISAGEQSLAVSYWRLGLALNLARRQFTHGQWAGFLSTLNIDKTRASKARAIQRSFESEQPLHGLSVQEAYRRRQRSPRKSSPRTKRRQKLNPSGRKSLISDWLLDICQQADGYRGEIDLASPEEASALIPVIESVVEELNRLRNELQQRSDAP